MHSDIWGIMLYLTAVSMVKTLEQHGASLALGIPVVDFSELCCAVILTRYIFMSTAPSNLNSW